MKKFLEVSKVDRDAADENAWFILCRENKVPFITVRVKTKFADVHWDHISFESEHDSTLSEVKQQVVDGAIDIFSRFSDKNSAYEVSEHLIWYRNLEISKARLAAADLYDLIARCIGPR